MNRTDHSLTLSLAFPASQLPATCAPDGRNHAQENHRKPHIYILVIRPFMKSIKPMVHMEDIVCSGIIVMF